MQETKGTNMGRLNRAPNVFLVLLWHHFCYYKRHYVLFPITLLMPFMMIGLLYLLSYELNDPSLVSTNRLGRIVNYTSCLKQTTPSFSSGPYHYSNLYDCKRYSSPYQDCILSGCTFPSNACVRESDYVEESISDRKIFCTRSNLEARNDGIANQPLVANSNSGNAGVGVGGSGSGTGSGTGTGSGSGSGTGTGTGSGTGSGTGTGTATATATANSTACSCSSLSPPNTPNSLDICSWLRGKIVYYPNTSSITVEIMKHVMTQINQFGSTLATIRNTTDSDFDQYRSNWPVSDLIALSRFVDCFEDAENRVFGYATRRDMFEYMKWMNDSLDTENVSRLGPIARNLNQGPSQILWAALNFENHSNHPSSIRYSILRDSTPLRIPNENSDKIIWIQDLLETAILKQRFNLTKLPIAPMWKELPSKCWTRPNSSTYTFLYLLLPLIFVIGFISAPMNFLEQVLTEKNLRLREYLSIMGVSDLKLKLSWIVFYMIFLIPASIVTAIFVHFLYGGPLVDTDSSVLMIQIVLFNLSLLCFAYFLSNFLTEPKRVSFIFGFLVILPTNCAVLAFHFSSYKLNGLVLLVVRLASIHCCVPFALSLCHVVNWQDVWIGAKWSYLFYSSNTENDYYGFGEGILWMMGDCVIYVILGWYLQHIMPGEYGMKKKFYFFLTPSYWIPKSTNHSSRIGNATESTGIVPDLEPCDRINQQATLVIDRLTKFYDGKVGIDGLCMNIYRNEITALLGQNGAGKSTTMNTLVGLLTPTSGRFTVAGMDCNRMSEIKKLLGFVPQYDILYPSMTVKEHLQFYGWLKGLDKHQIHSTVYPLLTKFGLDHLKETITTKLSGGEKRKLSILTAYLGDPELVILDEPTTGVDPVSRRCIWDVMLHHRLTTATIICTHFMDEADLLSDRIAIVSQGTLRCVGSPMYIKNKYARGFRIVTACNDESAKEKTKRFFERSDSRIQLSQINGMDLTFTIPKEYARSQRMIDLLKSIEVHRDRIGVESFGVNEPTLEEAFFNAAGVDPNWIQENEIDFDTRSTMKYKNQLGFNLCMNQFLALLKKRVILAIRIPSAIILQILLPLMFIMILLLTSNQLNQSTIKVKPITIYETYRRNVLFYQDKTQGSREARSIFETLIQRGLGPRCPNGVGAFSCGLRNLNAKAGSTHQLNLSVTRRTCTDCTTYCPEGNSRTFPNYTIPSTDLIYTLPYTINATDWILAANQSDHWIVGGFQIYSFDYTLDHNTQLGRLLNETTPKSYVVIWSRPEMKMAMLNAFNNLLLQTYSTDETSTILSNIESVRFPNPDDQSSMNVLDIISSFIGSFLLVISFTYATFGISVNVQHEKVSNIKDLQYIAGVKPWVYWLANYVWDYVQFIITFIVLVVFLYVFENGLKSNLVHYVNIIIPYGLSSVGFVYTLSFRFESPTGVNRLILIFGFVSLAMGTLICTYEFYNTLDKRMCMLIPQPCELRYKWVIIGTLLRFVPYYFLADGCFTITLIDTIGSLGGKDVLNVYDMDMIGKRIVQGYVVATFWVLVVIGLEYWRGVVWKRSSPDPGPDPDPGTPGVDPDVSNEERKVMHGKVTDPVVLRRVSKTYKNATVPAVDSVTFSIPRSECFGLLGVNGAGKSSLFKIMTGFESTSKGECLIEGRNTMNEKYILSNYISYCPQENTLFDDLNVLEHLKLFAALRGIPSAYIKHTIETLIDEVGLKEHEKKLAKQLSGGNQRKLNFAIALLDYKPVLFLDEPTSGMDPGARRRTWSCVQNAIQRGCSVILTSHSMEECEALCHRVVIMVRGKLRCIGSIQYLKNKFGNRYTMKIKLRPHSRDEQTSHTIDQLKARISRHLTDARIIEEHDVMLQYEVGASDDGLTLSTIFATLSECANAFPQLVEDFTLSQVTLERVFVGMAQQEVKDDHPVHVEYQVVPVIYKPTPVEVVHA